MTDSSSEPRPQPTVRSAAARGGAVTLLSQAAKVFIALASVVILSRLISPSDFGLLVMVTAISGVATIFMDFGLSMAALRSPTITHQQQSNLFWINAVTGLVLAAIMFGLSWPVSYFYGEPRLITMMNWLALTFVFSGFTTQFRVALNRAMRFSALAVAEVSAVLLSLLGAVAIAALGHGLVALVAQQLLNVIVLLVITVIQARWWPSWPRKTPGMRKLLSFGGGMAATQVLSYVTRNIDSVAIGRVWGSVELGLYDRAYRLSVAPVIQLNQPMTRVAMPVLSRHIDDPKRFLAVLREGQLIACYVTASVLMILAGVADPLVRTLLGPEWSSAGPLLSVLAIGATFRAGQQVVNWIFFAMGLAGSLLRFNLWAQPMVVVFILAGLPWGAMGVAIGSAVGYAVYWAASFIWAARATALDLRPLMFNAARIIGLIGVPAGAFAWIAVYFFDTLPAVQLIIGLASAVLWFGIAYAVSRKTRTEVRTLWGFVRLAVGKK